MNTTLFGGKLPMRATVLPLLAAVLFITLGCSVDATKFTCTSSEECPTGYHCDMGTAATAGTFKCASGAAQRKTLAVDANKVLLATRPGADGTVRTTISAGLGAVTSTPDFVGVRLVAKQGNTDVAESKVLADGSVLGVQVPSALVQSFFRIEDDSGHSIPVTGFRQQVVMSFQGKDVPGNANPIAAYDAATATDSLFSPVGWIGTLTEVAQSSPVTNNMASPAAYNGLASFDGVSSNTAVPAQPTPTVLGWEQLANAPTAVFTGLEPSPRSGAAIAQLSVTVSGNNYQYIAYGGVDGAGALADSSPTIYAFNPNGIGWTTVPTNVSTSSSPYPTRFYGSAGVDNPVTRANAAMGATFAYSPGVTNFVYNFFIAGGTDASGTMTSKVYAYGDRITTTNGNKFSGWWDESVEFAGAHLAQPNANMAYAPLFNIPVPQTASASPFQYAGMVLVGGRSNTAGAVNDASGCQYITSTSYQAPPSFQVSNCTSDPSLVNANQWLTATGGIGFRTGMALAPTDNGESAVYLFGGNRSGATSPTLNGLQNDLWKGTISVVCNPINAGNGPPPCTTAGATISTQISWTLVSIAGASPKPSPRSGAMLASGDFRKMVLYGGTDATGIRQDVWELDISGSPPFNWRQLSLDAAPALAPGARSDGVLLGSTFFDSNYATFLFGGAAATGPVSDVWVLSKQSAGRLLVKAPAGLSAPDLATNMTMSLRWMGTYYLGAPAYIWNGPGHRWDFVSNPVVGAAFASVSRPLSYLQPDGNFYFLFNSRNRSTPTYNNTQNLVSLDGLEVTLDFQ